MKTMMNFLIKQVRTSKL